MTAPHPAPAHRPAMGVEPFRPPHGFDCPVCFPPEERSLLRPLFAVAVAVGLMLAFLWLTGSAS